MPSHFCLSLSVFSISDPMAYYQQVNPLFAPASVMVDQKYANGVIMQAQYPGTVGAGGGQPDTALDMYSVPSVCTDSLALNTSYHLIHYYIYLSLSQVIHDAPRWSWCSMIWSALTCCFCFSPFGFIALLFSLTSYTDHKSGDYSRASYKRRCAWGCAMTGIALSVLLAVALVLLFVVYLPETASQLCNWGYNSYCGVQCRYLSCWEV